MAERTIYNKYAVSTERTEASTADVGSGDCITAEKFMTDKILKFIEQHQMLEGGDAVVAGISGGADSVCLLLVLHSLKERYALKLTAVHINHGIRGAEADRDEAFVRTLCGSLEVPCVIFKENVPEYAALNGLTEEEAGRLIRYRRFAEVCRRQGSGKLAVAHNADDQTETILFHIIRGSSLAGLCGMKPVSLLQSETEYREAGATDGSGHLQTSVQNGSVQKQTSVQDGGVQKQAVVQSENIQKQTTDSCGTEQGCIRILRPLLCTARTEIEEYLKSVRADWCEDSTNSTEEYSRNYIRHSLLPAMEKLGTAVSEHIRALGSEAAEAKEFIDRETERYYREGCTGNRLSVQSCEAAPEVIKKEMIYRFICENAGHKKDIQRIHVLNILELLKNEVGKSVDLPYDITVRRDYEHLLAINRNDNRQRADRGEKQEILIDKDGRYNLGNGRHLLVRTFPFDKKTEIPKEKFRVWFDADKIGQKLVLRAPVSGDYFCPYTDGRRKKLSRLLIEAKVSREDRAELLVAAAGSRCIWIPGIRRDEALRLDDNSETVLELCLERAEQEAAGK